MASFDCDATTAGATNCVLVQQPHSAARGRDSAVRSLALRQELEAFGEIAQASPLPAEDGAQRFRVVYYDVRCAMSAKEAFGDLCEYGPQEGSRAIMAAPGVLEMLDLSGASSMTCSKDGNFQVEFYDTRAAAESAAYVMQAMACRGMFAAQARAYSEAYSTISTCDEIPEWAAAATPRSSLSSQDAVTSTPSTASEPSEVFSDKASTAGTDGAEGPEEGEAFEAEHSARIDTLLACLSPTSRACADPAALGFLEPLSVPVPVEENTPASPSRLPGSPGSPSPVAVERPAECTGRSGPQKISNLRMSELRWDDLAKGREQRTALRLRGLPRSLCEPGALDALLRAHGLGAAVASVRVAAPAAAPRAAGAAVVTAASTEDVPRLAKFFHGRQFGGSMLPVAVSFAAERSSATAARVGRSGLEPLAKVSASRSLKPQKVLSTFGLRAELAASEDSASSSPRSFPPGLLPPPGLEALVC